jgi:hypothetical protein
MAERRKAEIDSGHGIDSVDNPVQIHMTVARAGNGERTDQFERRSLDRLSKQP